MECLCAVEEIAAKLKSWSLFLYFGPITIDPVLRLMERNRFFQHFLCGSNWDWHEMDHFRQINESTHITAICILWRKRVSVLSVKIQKIFCGLPMSLAWPRAIHFQSTARAPLHLQGDQFNLDTLHPDWSWLYVVKNGVSCSVRQHWAPIGTQMPILLDAQLCQTWNGKPNTAYAIARDKQKLPENRRNLFGPANREENRKSAVIRWRGRNGHIKHIKKNSVENIHRLSVEEMPN